MARQCRTLAAGQGDAAFESGRQESADGFIGFSAALQSKDPTELLVGHFQSADLDPDDPFNPQSQAFWNDILWAAR